MDIFIALLTVATVVIGLAVAYIIGFRIGRAALTESDIRRLIEQFHNERTGKEHGN